MKNASEAFKKEWKKMLERLKNPVSTMNSNLQNNKLAKKLKKQPALTIG